MDEYLDTIARFWVPKEKPDSNASGIVLIESSDFYGTTLDVIDNLGYLGFGASTVSSLGSGALGTASSTLETDAIKMQRPPVRGRVVPS